MSEELKKLKGKCPNCENKFVVTAKDFIMTQNTKWETLCPMIRCPYCNTYLYKTTGFFCERIWEEPSWAFKVQGV